jgi:hypothetical protein
MIPSDPVANAKKRAGQNRGAIAMIRSATRPAIRSIPVITGDAI